MYEIICRIYLNPILLLKLNAEIKIKRVEIRHLLDQIALFRSSRSNFMRSIRINFRETRRAQLGILRRTFHALVPGKKIGEGTDSDPRNIRLDCSRDRCRGYYFSRDRSPAGARSTEANPGSLSNHKA